MQVSTANSIIPVKHVNIPDFTVTSLCLSHALATPALPRFIFMRGERQTLDTGASKRRGSLFVDFRAAGCPTVICGGSHKHHDGTCDLELQCQFLRHIYRVRWRG